MGVTIYAGRLSEDKVLEPVLDIEQEGNSMDLSNRNGQIVLEAIGCGEGGALPISKVLEGARAWLESSEGRLSPMVADREHFGNCGAHIIDCGLPEGYLNRRILALYAMCIKGEALGADYISAHI